ncbi:MAG: phenylacetate--CoA ligase family protein [bacterium]
MPEAAGLPVRSAIDGIAWPAVPDQAGEALLAMLWQMERSERFAPARLRSLQMVQVRALLRHAAAHVPFYADLWAGLGRERLGFDPAVDTLTPKRFSALPVVTREMIRGAGEAAFSKTVPQAHGAVQTSLTAGTTGAPLHFRTTGLTQFMWRAFSLRDHLWHRRDLTGKLAMIRSTPGGRAEAPDWDRAASALCSTGPAVGLPVEHDIVEQVAWLVEQNPHSLITHPGNLYALAGWFSGHGLKLPRLRDIRTVSERVTPEQRAACRAAFGRPLVDSYSTRELGYLALQCPRHEHYHVQEEGVLLELLDEGGQPVPRGRAGRVVVTSLHNFAMPFVRYDTGDYAIAGAACDCGRGLAVLDRIVGRGRNLISMPDGSRRWPGCELISLDVVPGIRQHQFVQTALDRVELRLVADQPLGAADQASLAAVVRERLGQGLELAVVRVDHLPRSADGGSEAFVNLLS